jgi:LPXTG-motif cell wall-anchored protein
MKMEDELPDEMERTGGSGLTEYWDNFEPGDTKEFIIKAKVDASEYDRKNFEKCIVNKAELRYGNKFEGADTATVCYSDSKPKELPKTGAESTALFAVLGLVTTASGLVMKKFAR